MRISRTFRRGYFCVAAACGRWDDGARSERCRLRRQHSGPLIFRVIPSEGPQHCGIVLQELRMEFGILFTSHSNVDTEPYPHRDVHARVTREVLRADELGFDYAWLAEHHFSSEYGIMPDVFVYAA
jgi:hypothetical protein